MKKSSSQVKGFTLIELLVVIAIIATLAAMATPVIMSVLTKAKILNAKNVCVALENASDRFEDDYECLPYVDVTPSDDTELYTAGDSITGKGPSKIMAVLAGLEDEVNYKHFKYFNYKAPKGAKGSYKDGMYVTNTTAELYDTWGNPYGMIFDYNVDDKIDDPFGGSDPISEKKVLVYSMGPEQKPLSSSMGNKEKKTIPRNF